MRRQGPRGPALQREGQLFGRLEALLLLERHRLQHDVVEPDRHIGPQPRGRLGRAPVTRRLVGLDVAERQVAGEQLVHADAQRKEVGLGVDGLVVPQLGVHVAGRAGMQAALLRRLIAGDSDTEVEQAQLAVVAEMQVAGLDVAVNHPQPVQAADGTGSDQAPGDHIADRQSLRPTLGGQLFQRLPGVPVEQQVERARVLHLVQAHEAGIGALADPRAQPGFVSEHGALLRVARA